MKTAVAVERRKCPYSAENGRYFPTCRCGWAADQPCLGPKQAKQAHRLHISTDCPIGQH